MDKTIDTAAKEVETSYEAPQVEKVLTASEMERELHYAGYPISHIYD